MSWFGLVVLAVFLVDDGQTSPAFCLNIQYFRLEALWYPFLRNRDSLPESSLLKPYSVETKSLAILKHLWYHSFAYLGAIPSDLRYLIRVTHTPMKRIFFLSLFVTVAAVPGIAQSTSYSFDNFDTANGVRIRVEPPKLPARRSARLSKLSAVQKSDATQTENPRSTVRLTSLTFDTRAIGNPSLRGYTTGSAQVDQYLVDSGTKNGVDPLLLYSIMHQESSFKSYAVSPKGARGLMQLMPFTAIRYGVTNIFDPKQNIEGGARYMRFLLNRFEGDLSLALAGYNAGEGAVDKYGWRIPPYSETQEYVRRISRRYSLLRDPNAALYAPSLTSDQIARLQNRSSQPLTVYERTVLAVRLPDGRLQLMNQ